MRIFFPTIKQAIKSGGFTIMEVMIAVSIIVIGILGVLSLVQQNTKVNYLTKNTIISSQLTQECLELARKKRDYNWLDPSTRHWDDNLSAGTFIIDFNDPVGGALTAVAGIEDAAAKLIIDNREDAEPGLNYKWFYDHDATGGTTTPYSRIMTISDKTAEGLMVTCTTRYKKDDQSYYYTAADYLYNWLW